MSAVANSTLMVGPDGYIRDPKTGIQYNKGRFLGKGGFAKCYSFTNAQTREENACKVVPKSLMWEQHQRDKMAQEVQIHRALQHENVVTFLNFFEDDANCYVLLEICTNKSLMELHKRRKTITEPECRYYVHQICNGVKYIHDRNVIHRDLKLGNLFLSSNLQVKIGDFGLACLVTDKKERKKTLCGTPNYIAPEVLYKTGHSFEVDIWAIGCIIYTFLIGRPPFETRSLRDTYDRIKKNEYRIPKDLSVQAAALVKSILQPNPQRRPDVQGIIDSDFLRGFTPDYLPVSCLTMAPRADVLQQRIRLSRKPLGQHNPTAGSPALAAGNAGMLHFENKEAAKCSLPSAPSAGKDVPPTPSALLLRSSGENLRALQTKLGMTYRSRTTPLTDDMQTPSATPLLWVSKWVDYSDKYGLGYQLSNDTIAVFFNDCTRLTSLPNEKDLLYMTKQGHESYYHVNQTPASLNKKMQLLAYFKDYMKQNLVKLGEQESRQDEDLSRVPVMHHWTRTRSAIVMYLSNGTFQINFFADHTKLIMCPHLSAVTFVGEDKAFRTYLFDDLAGDNGYGVPPEFAQKLTYGLTMVQKIIQGDTDGSSKHRVPARLGAQSSNKVKPPFR